MRLWKCVSLLFSFLFPFLLPLPLPSLFSLTFSMINVGYHTQIPDAFRSFLKDRNKMLAKKNKLVLANLEPIELLWGEDIHSSFVFKLWAGSWGLGVTRFPSTAKGVAAKQSFVEFWEM